MNSISVASAADRISLPKLAAEQGVSPVSTWRWALRGCRGVVLPTFCVGHKRYTTRVAFQAWCEQVTAAANGQPQCNLRRRQESLVVNAERVTAEFGV